MSRLFLLLNCFALLHCLNAQSVTDDFSDGDLLNPSYLGDVQNFTVTDGRLQLMAPEAGTSLIYLPVQTDPAQTVVYEISAQLDFSPSTSNFSEIRLSGLDTDGVAVEYTLKIGGISGNDDALVFSAARGGSSQELISGTTGAAGTSTVNVRIRLERTAANVWTLMADYTGGNNFQNEGSATDPFGSQAATLDQFGIYCRYTSTRTDKFFFDDLLIEPILVDETAPTLLEAQTTADNQVELTFSEVIAGAAASQASNYSSNIDGLDVTAVSLEGPKAILTFNQNLPLGQNITITAAAVEDMSGNVANNLMASLFIPITTTPSASNLIITEFMADPTPEVRLPNAEYVEIYNRGDTLIVLDGLTIASGGTPVNIEGNIEAGQYLILTRAGLLELFPETANGIEIPLPSLSNGGDEIVLAYNGQELHRIDYTTAWYKDGDRANGGYSLELANLNATDINCSGYWAASVANDGGTPGLLNSRDGQQLDTEGPQLLAAVFSNNGIRMTFSESLDLASFDGNISLEPSLGEGTIIRENSNNYLLVLENDPQPNTLYTLTTEAELKDCVGNFSDSSYQVQLGLASEVAVGDVIINEILFNPYTGGKDFVEIFNCSDKILNVEGWSIANNRVPASTGLSRVFIDADRLLLPGGYLVFTESPENILETYNQAQAAFLIDNNLPFFPNESGNVSLISPRGDTLDTYNYSEDQHSALLDDENGVSLERVNPKAATQQDGNWFSAASRVGFATPTRENSQRRDGIMNPTDNSFFFLDEETFSPNGDGYQDALLINYNTPGIGWNARITIYDANGRLIRSLRRAELLAGNGSIIWDGTNDDRMRARTGIYVLLIERFNPNGETANEKLVAVLVNED